MPRLFDWLREIRAFAAQHAADRRVLLALPPMRELIADAVPLWVDQATDANRPNIRAFRHYGVKARFPDGEAFIRVVLREDNDGHIYYDNDTTTVEALDTAKAPDGDRQPGRKPNLGEDAEGLSRNRLAQVLAAVNGTANRDTHRTHPLSRLNCRHAASRSTPLYRGEPSTMMHTRCGHSLSDDSMTVVMSLARCPRLGAAASMACGPIDLRDMDTSIGDCHESYT